MLPAIDELSRHQVLRKNFVGAKIRTRGCWAATTIALILFVFLQSATAKSGGCYLFSNLRGCDGDRVFWNGLSSITLNGIILTRSAQFAIQEVEVTAATIDLEEIRSYRNLVR